MHDDEDATQTALEQAAQDQLPVFQILAAGLAEAGQHAFLAIAAETDDEVNTGGLEAIAVSDFDILAIAKQGQQVGIQRTSIAQLQFFHETDGNFFQLLLRAGQTHFVQSIAAAETDRLELSKPSSSD